MNLENIIKKSQKNLKEALYQELIDLEYEPISRDGFLYAQGQIPVLLIAHMDTVHTQRVENICYTRDDSIMMSPEGIGGDDRAGVYMTLQIIKQCHCHVLFCEDEEVGGVGARKFTKSKINPDVNYIIEMDRRGHNDAVFYDCDNPNFTNFICSFDFEKASGSFSDISVIAPHLGVAAVNISAGYYNAHSRYEYINLEEMQNNIERIIDIVKTPQKKYRYIKRKYQASIFKLDSYNLSFFDEPEAERIEFLMVLPHNAYLRKEGEIIKNGSAYLMDEKGFIYDYLPQLDAAVKLKSTTAHSKSDTPLRFISVESEPVRVISIDDALSQMDLLCYKAS